MADHSLLFKVLRLRPAAFDLPNQSRFDFAEDIGPEAAKVNGAIINAHLPFSERVQLRTGTIPGISGTLVLSQAFGSVYLGQTLSLAISLCNTSPAAAKNIGIRVSTLKKEDVSRHHHSQLYPSFSHVQIEIQSDHGKTMLYDTLSDHSLEKLTGGDCHEVLVRYEVKDLGNHTLLCASSYTSAVGELRYHPQAFTFQAQISLSITTKHRSVGYAKQTIFLEATIENCTRESMLLEDVGFVPSDGFTAHRVDCPNTTESSRPSGSGPLAEMISNMPLLPPDGGSLSYVFCLGRESSSSEFLLQGASHSDILGRLDIRWRGPMGDSARLQTQPIGRDALSPRRDVWLTLTSLPDKLHVEEPFQAEITVVSTIDRRLGPLKVSYNPQKTKDRAVVLDGLQSVLIAEVAPQGRASVRITLFPRIIGRAFIEDFMLTNERDGRVYDTLQPVEVFIHRKYVLERGANT